MEIKQQMEKKKMEQRLKTVFALQKSTQKENTHELYIYDDITKYGEFNWETWEYDESETSAEHIKNLLQEIPDGMNLDIHINSNGGEVYEAVTIYNLLKQSKNYKTAYVDGVAHSAAFILLFACDYVVMGLGTVCLLHNIWTYVSGNAKQLRDAADRLDAMMESNRKIYMEKAKNITEEELKQMMDDETMLTPEKCLELGFCDEIGNSMKDVEREEQNIQQRAEQLAQLARAQEGMRQQMLLFTATAPTREQREETQPERQKEKPNRPKQEALTILSAFLCAAEQTSKEEIKC